MLVLWLVLAWFSLSQSVLVIAQPTDQPGSRYSLAVPCSLTACKYAVVVHIHADYSEKQSLNSICFRVPFVVVRWLQRKEDELNPGFFAPLQDEEMALWTLTMGMGLVVALVFALQGLAVAFVDREKFQKAPRPFPFCLSGAPERRLYCATKFKIGKILSNALSLHRFDELDLLSASIQKKHLATRIALAATRDGVSRNFLAHGETYEEAGGVLWTFWKLCDGSLFRQEGIWLNSRLLLIQVNQVLVGIALMFFYLLIASVLADKADSERAAIVRKHADKLGPDLLEWVLDIIPTGKMIRQSLIPAAYVAMVVMIGTIVIYIPRYEQLLHSGSAKVHYRKRLERHFSHVLNLHICKQKFRFYSHELSGPIAPFVGLGVLSKVPRRCRFGRLT